MNKVKLEKLLLHIIIALLMLCVLVLFGMVIRQRKKIQQLIILSRDEVGIMSITEEIIVSARFDSTIPDYIYEVTDFKIAEELLDTLKNASFQKCDKPKKVFWMEIILIETKAHTYALGVQNGIFVVVKDGKTDYYHCSNKGDFIAKLCELQGR